MHSAFPTVSEDLLLFSVGGLRCAVPLLLVDRVFRAVAVCRDSAPEGFLGTVNYHGEQTPVLLLSSILGGYPSDLASDQIMIRFRWKGRALVLLADEVAGVTQAPISLETASLERPGVARLQGGALLVKDFGALLPALAELSASCEPFHAPSPAASFAAAH